MRNAGLEETQAGIKIARRNINNLRYADDTTLVAESEEELKSLLMGVLFLPPSDAYVRSFLYLLYTSIKLYYTKALSNQASSLTPD